MKESGLTTHPKGSNVPTRNPSRIPPLSTAIHRLQVLLIRRAHAPSRLLHPLSPAHDCPGCALSFFFPPTSTGQTIPPMPFSKTLDGVYNEPFRVLHSSGTTGPPKPILLTHGAFVSITPLTARLPRTDQIHKHGDVQVTVVPPKCFREIVQNRSWLGNLSRLQYLAYLGAPCSSHIGGIWAAKTRVTTLYGSTESGMYPNELMDPDDWE